MFDALIEAYLNHSHIILHLLLPFNCVCFTTLMNIHIHRMDFVAEQEQNHNSNLRNSGCWPKNYLFTTGFFLGEN